MLGGRLSPRYTAIPCPVSFTPEKRQTKPTRTVSGHNFRMRSAGPVTKASPSRFWPAALPDGLVLGGVLVELVAVWDTRAEAEAMVDARNAKPDSAIAEMARREEWRSNGRIFWEPRAAPRDAPVPGFWANWEPCRRRRG